MTRVNKNTHIIQYLASFKLAWVVITLAVFCALIKLSFWQYERGVEKQLRVDRIAKLGNQQAIPLATLLKQVNDSDNSFADVNDIAIRVIGEFVQPMVFLLDNQVDSGKTGYKVFAVFNDQSSGRQLLINLGWVAGSLDRSYIPEISIPKGQLELNGRVRLDSQGIVLQEQVFDELNWPIRVQQIDSEKFSQLINTPLLPFSLILDKKESIGYKKSWQPIVMPPEKHFGYATQWGLLALAWLSLMLVASYTSFKRQNNNNFQDANSQHNTDNKGML
ncbi:SURF1 family protein [Thalassotalea sp. HSM 43]|uniref:SURF1 family protein n=1 Tax=Thalassotalea sp. HSM 43 TaxID=2552945 RepID=UPI00108093B5|nr:SURF1 family protein [Thalassotalea sp. HSM 43]QBY04092.1 SURF1 family protein [Thalassotalea sp. HSM 43]